MSTVSEIIEAVKKLPERDKSEFLERLGEAARLVAGEAGFVSSCSSAAGTQTSDLAEDLDIALLAGRGWTSSPSPTGSSSYSASRRSTWLTSWATPPRARPR